MSAATVEQLMALPPEFLAMVIDPYDDKSECDVKSASYKTSHENRN
jgi:hypothetical protein